MSVAVNFAGSEAAAAETVALCEQAASAAGGGDAAFIAVQADVSSPPAAESLVAEVCERLGNVEVLVNNAGITRDNLMMRMSLEDFDAVLNTNLRSAFHLSKLVSRAMVKARWGRIVNITSVAGIAGNKGQANYAASKAGVIGLTKSLAKELGAKGITCNAVAPGFIQTDMTSVLSEERIGSMLGRIAVGRAGTPEDIAAAVAFLASEEAGFVSGHVLTVDGCMSI
jgi:3-oxoacyl-[acyl-carrier protein] reductase